MNDAAALDKSVHKKKWIVLAAVLLAAKCWATADSFNEAFYAGITGGYGSTTWQGLVALKEKQNSAILLSTPQSVQEGGGVLGFFGGYEFSPNIALELNYLRYPKAHIFFSEDSLFAFEHDGLTSMESNTQTLDVFVKLLLPIPHTAVRVFTETGIARIVREDMLLEQEWFSPTFGAGLVYSMTEHTLVQLSFNYTAGYGESELTPADSYIPFLYSALLGIAYRF